MASVEKWSLCGGVVVVGASVYGVSEVRVTSSFPMSFMSFFRILVSSEGHSFYDFRGTSSNPVFFDSSCFFLTP